jgi:glycosyltransferase involved in cell wall biosynthesis
MRIAYWTTSCLQPEIEAVSKEVFQLADYFRRSLVFGISPHYALRASWTGRYIGFHPRFDSFLRIAIPFIERHFDVNHVYGEANPWTFYKTLRCKPLVITVASEKGVPRVDFLERCRKVFVQTNSFYRRLQDLGIEAEKLELLYPGVDLKRFRPQADRRLQTKRPRILFASAPRSEEEMESRGVYLLLQAAQINPEVQYHLLYRAWNRGYTSLAATTKWLDNHTLSNVTLTNNIVPNMHFLYPNYDFTVIPYTQADGGKECPTSVVEGLACGLPALISSRAPFAEFVEHHKCGVVFDPTSSNLVSAIETGMREYRELSANAMSAAHRYFSSERLFLKMTQLYQDILN